MKRKNITTHMMKEYISKSLLILMAQKDFLNITINEITDKAGVNRSTYYRNFSSKEDIVKFYFSNIMQNYLDEYKTSKNHSFENYMLTLFKHFHKYKKEMAEELLSSFIHEMQDLGFEKDDIISKIADYKEERR